MKRWLVLAGLVVAGFFWRPVQTPAPLVYRPGEGWVYESPSGAKWQKARAQDQYEVAKEAFEGGRYRLATKAARRTVARWPLSDYAPEAQYLVGLSYEYRRRDEKAFKEYQKLVEQYPKFEKFETVVIRQFEIANRFLAGQWFRLWGVIPLFPSMERTAKMYQQVLQNGPYSRIAPLAQLNLGLAREKQKDYLLAVRAYEKAADQYGDDPHIAAEALYRTGMAWYRQAKTAEYDQSAAGNAIDAFTDFIILYPKDPRVPRLRELIQAMRTEQARGALEIARYYHKRHKLDGARVYYNEVIRLAPESVYAEQARQRLAELQPSSQATPAEAGHPDS